MNIHVFSSPSPASALHRITIPPSWIPPPPLCTLPTRPLIPPWAIITRLQRQWQQLRQQHTVLPTRSSNSSSNNISTFLINILSSISYSNIRISTLVLSRRQEGGKLELLLPQRRPEIRWRRLWRWRHQPPPASLARVARHWWRRRRWRRASPEITGIIGWRLRCHHRTPPPMKRNPVYELG